MIMTSLLVRTAVGVRIIIKVFGDTEHEDAHYLTVMLLWSCSYAAGWVMGKASVL